MITIEGLEETEELLDKLNRIDEPMQELCRELCEMAQGVVESKYSTWGSASGNTDFRTEIEKTPDGYRLIASGEDIGFLEFGAGAFTDADEFADQVGYAIYPGSWSESEGTRAYADRGFWLYHNVHYTGITPSRGMHYALEEILNEIEERAKEKIEQWLGL